MTTNSTSEREPDCHAERPVIDVTKQHDFIQIAGSDRCGLRGCTLGVLEHGWIPRLPSPASSPVHTLLLNDGVAEHNTIDAATPTPVEQAREKGPERVWITWDDAYPWETPETGGDEYVRAEGIREVLEGLRRRSGCWCSNFYGHEQHCLDTHALWSKLQPKGASDRTE